MRFLRRPFRRALRVVLEDILKGTRVYHATTEERGWKLIFLPSRLLLHRPGRGGVINKSNLMARFEMFVRGEWKTLIKSREDCAFKAAFTNTRRRRTERGLKHRISQAESVVHLDELSAVRRILEGARGRSRIDRDTRCIEEETSDVWRDLSSSIDPSQTRSLVCPGRRSLQQELEDAKRGAAAGPSGMTVEHLQSLLEHPKGLRLFFQVTERLTRG